MEKPRKHKYSDKGYCYGCEEFSPCSHNALIDAMSTWIEGELPKKEDIRIALRESCDKNELGTFEVDLYIYADVIHSLLTQRLGGK